MAHGFDEFFGILYHLNAGEYTLPRGKRVRCVAGKSCVDVCTAFAQVAVFMQSLKDYPPRQASVDFNIDEVVRLLQSADE